MILSDLFPISLFQDDVDNGYIKIVEHEHLPIAIANYTSRAQIDGHWDAATTRCRGLIYELDTLEVIATGPAKFHNYGDAATADLRPSDLCFVTVKADGSLGIGWAYNGLVGVATRGSFDSPQALHATEMLTDVMRDSIINSANHVDPETLIYEIIHPENRVIVDYGTADILVPLGVVDNASGLIVERPAPMYQADGTHTLAEALALPIPDDEEGYVLDIVNSELATIGHVKLKGATYRTLHAAKFDLHERRVFEHMQSDTLGLLLDVLPDETHEWVYEIRDRIVTQNQTLYRDALAGALHAATLPTRKDQAIYINQNYPEIRSAVFLALDGNWDKLTLWIHNQTKPEAIPFKAKELVS